MLGPQQQEPLAQCGDLLVRDRLGHWTYQFAVTVDDLVEGITDVIRGRDLLPSTGRQIQLARLLGRSTPPTFLHHPLILGADGEKLSKSRHDTSLRELRAAGLSAPRSLRVPRPRCAVRNLQSAICNLQSAISMNRRAFLRMNSPHVPSNDLARFLAPAVMSRVLQDANAPVMPGGVQVGDVTDTRAMHLERHGSSRHGCSWKCRATSASRRPRLIEGPAALEDTRFTAKIDLGGLTPGEPVFYRVWFDDLARPGLLSAQTVRPVPRRALGRAPTHDLLVRRCRRPGLGHRRSSWRHAPLRDDGAARARSVHPLGRPDLRRRPAEAGGRARRRHRVAECRDRGQAEGGRDAGRVPRQLRLQPARPPRARLQQPGADDRAVGRSRSAEQLEPRHRSGGSAPVHRAQHRDAGGARQARDVRVPADSVASRRGRARLSRLRVRSACRGHRPGPAKLSVRQWREPAGLARDRTRG